MKGSPFLTAQTINLRGTQWETRTLKSYAAKVRPAEIGAGYVAKVKGTLVKVEQRGRFWVIVP